MSAAIHPAEVVEYPDSDGKPMAETTLKFDWIVTIKANLDAIFRDDPNVFVAGSGLIYPNPDSYKTSITPSVYVAFGRPKKKRGSYKVWAEGGVFPQVVFELEWLGTTELQLTKKRKFYERYGAEELYILDPAYKKFSAWIREGNRLRPQSNHKNFISPRLRIRFHSSDDDLALYRPDGQKFRTFLELEDRANRFAAKLRSLGIDPDGV